MLDNFISKKGHDMAYVFSSVTHLPANSKSINSKQDTWIKDIPSVHSSINSFMNIGTGYSFYRYYYLKGKIALLLSSSTNVACFDTDCSVMLYDITFFCIQVPDIPIQKEATPITVLGLGANKHATN